MQRFIDEYWQIYKLIVLKPLRAKSDILKIFKPTFLAIFGEFHSYLFLWLLPLWWRNRTQYMHLLIADIQPVRKRAKCQYLAGHIHQKNHCYVNEIEKQMYFDHVEICSKINSINKNVYICRTNHWKEIPWKLVL